LSELTATGADKEPPIDEIKATVCSCLHQLLPTLRPSYAELLRRIDLEGESPQDLSQELNVTPNNLTVRLHRARKALRAELEKACGVCSKHGCIDCTCS
jgi:RNA polymerase sigma-70 factor (ECF subfamily)